MTVDEIVEEAMGKMAKLILAIDSLPRNRPTELVLDKLADVVGEQFESILRAAVEKARTIGQSEADFLEGYNEGYIEGQKNKEAPDGKAE